MYKRQESDRPIAAVCSEQSAKRYGLEILARNIQNSKENYTRFLVISPYLYPSQACDTISVALTLPHEVGSLYQLLTKFAVCGVNLTKICLLYTSRCV